MTDNYDYDNGFEDWEADANLLFKEDWEGLLKLRKDRYELNPSDPDAQYHLGEAFILSKKYEEAIKFFTPIYNEDPENGNVIHQILDVLFLQGKTEKDFKWIMMPEILRLDNKLKEQCFKILKNKRKPFRLAEVCLQLMLNDAYLAFDENELAEFLKMDNNFDIEGEESFWYCKLKKVKIKNKKS
jgi:tetratricopeptide (TPR) repeat protein